MTVGLGPKAVAGVALSRSGRGSNCSVRSTVGGGDKSILFGDKARMVLSIRRLALSYRGSERVMTRR